MTRKESIRALAFGIISPSLLKDVSVSQAESFSFNNAKPKNTAYLMAHFMPEQKLYYAYSRNARDWISLNHHQPVFDPGVNLRDPYLHKVKDTYHLVHTKGWDYPVIYHWESKDLINWEGGPIQVVKPEQKRAWAPEFYYEEREDVFYVYWASVHNGHNTIFYTKTKDWKDISPEHSKVFYDLGVDDIDLTITKYKGTYYGFHKPGGVKDLMGIRMISSPTLDPEDENFAFGKNGPGEAVLPDELKPTEGPEVIKVNGEQKWYVYNDPFHSNMQAWQTSDFKTFEPVKVTLPDNAKHCGIIPITETALQRLLKHYH